MSDRYPAEPTAAQCNANEKVYEFGDSKDTARVGYATWYPQMGGYSGKAVAVFDKQWTQFAHGAARGGCIDVYVWHDGEFPFSDGLQPVCLHHCDPEQFIKFGEMLARRNEAGKVEEEQREA